ncbi:MAG: replicative helicase loader/inhibitor [Acidobacteriaceae bacterium]
MTDRDAVRVLSWCCAAYPNVTLAKETVEIWATVLADLPAAVVDQAVKRIIATQEIPSLPTPGRVRREAAALTGVLPPSAELAWEEVMDAVRRHGYTNAPRFSNELAERAMRSIGWRQICMSESLGVERGQFLRIYASLAEEVGKEAMLPEGLRAGAIGGGPHLRIAGKEIEESA